MILLVALSLFFSAESFAGDTKGQGGDILVCKRADRTTYESFDLYERYNYRLSLAFGETTTSEEIVEKVLSRLMSLDPQRYCLYKKYLESFSRESEYIETEIEPINDEGLPIIPHHCKLQQAAIQTILPDAAGIKYRFYRPAVEQLNELHRTALFFHEFVYRDGLAHNTDGFKDSQEVRYFTAFLFSNQFQEVTQKRYSEMLRVVRLPVLENQCQ